MTNNVFVKKSARNIFNTLIKFNPFPVTKNTVNKIKKVKVSINNIIIKILIILIFNHLFFEIRKNIFSGPNLKSLINNFIKI